MLPNVAIVADVLTALGPVRRREMTLAQLAHNKGYGRDDLICFTNQMIDLQMSLIEDIADQDVVFTPIDPDADDPYAVDPDAGALAWTLGHVIVHCTASSEECCAQASNLARGVEVSGRMRYETPWQQVRTAEQARQRLAESRRIRLAYLNAWPDQPHMDLTYTPYKSPQNCVTRVLAGLFHDADHLDQIAEIVVQAREASR